MIYNLGSFSTPLPSSYLFLIARRVKIFCLIIKYKTYKTRIHLISKAKTITYINILFNIWSTLTKCSLRWLNIYLSPKLLLRTIDTLCILELMIIYLFLASKIVIVKSIDSVLTKLTWFFLLCKKLFEILFFEIFRRRTREYSCRQNLYYRKSTWGGVGNFFKNEWITINENFNLLAATGTRSSANSWHNSGYFY